MPELQCWKQVFLCLNACLLLDLKLRWRISLILDYRSLIGLWKSWPDGDAQYQHVILATILWYFVWCQCHLSTPIHPTMISMIPNTNTPQNPLSISFTGFSNSHGLQSLYHWVPCIVLSMVGKTQKWIYCSVSAVRPVWMPLSPHLGILICVCT